MVSWIPRAPISEAQLQRAILEALHFNRILAWPVDAGAKKMRGKALKGMKLLGGDSKACTAFMKKGKGDAPVGFPDIVGVLPGGRALFIEVKRPAGIGQDKGRPTPEQRHFIAIAVKAGAAAGFAWSVDDALEIAGLIEERMANDG